MEVDINCRFWTTSASGHVTAAILFSDGRFLFFGPKPAVYPYLWSKGGNVTCAG